MVRYLSDCYYEVEVVENNTFTYKRFKHYKNAKAYVESNKETTTGNIFTREFEDARKD